MSKETLSIVLGVGSIILSLALYLIDNSGRSLPPYAWVILLFLLAAVGLTAILLIPWFWSPISLAEKIWRISLASTAVLLLVGRFGIWLGFMSPSPAKSVDVAPAGFISFAGQIIQGQAPVLQENQTDTPLDDTHLTIIQSLMKSESDPGPYEAPWHKDIDIGTVRAKLTIGLNERLPIGGQNWIRFDIIMLTRLATYREVIKLTKESERQYKAVLTFTGAGTSYTRNSTLEIVSLLPPVLHAPMSPTSNREPHKPSSSGPPKTESKPPTPPPTQAFISPDPHLGIPNSTLALWARQEADELQQSGEKCWKDGAVAVQRKNKGLPIDPINGYYGPEWIQNQFWKDYQDRQEAIANLHKSLTFRLGPVATKSAEAQYKMMLGQVSRTDKSEYGRFSLCAVVQEYAKELRKMADLLNH